MTVLRYTAAAWSKAASAARFLCNKVPASKMVCATLPATDQKAVPGGLMNWPIAVEALPALELPAPTAERFALDPDDFSGCRDLTAHRRFLHRCGDDVRGQCQISGLELVALELGLRRQRFDLPPCAAEDIRHVAHGQLA